MKGVRYEFIGYRYISKVWLKENMFQRIDVVVYDVMMDGCLVRMCPNVGVKCILVVRSMCNL